MVDHAQELLSCAVVSPDILGASLHEEESASGG
jgi:hypothetical protein